MKTMYIMRGLPGSGKSYRANQIASLGDAVILSTDSIWEVGANNKYYWVAEFVGAAHRINQAKTKLACIEGIERVIVDNTNTTFREMEPYLEIAKENGYEVVVAESHTSWAFNVKECARRNSHSVPEEVIQKMADRFEPTEQITKRIEKMLEKVGEQ